MKLAKAAYRAGRDLISLAVGGLRYALSGQTPESGYQAMIRLFCKTGGYSNDLLAGLVRATGRKSELPVPNGDLGIASPKDVDRVTALIRRDGYYVFDKRLPVDACDRLLNFALSTPARVRPMTGQQPRGGERRTVYDRARPLAIRYDFDADDVLGCPDVQMLLASPSVLSVAQSYLDTTPIADVVSMWWHTAFSTEPDEDAAQFFHFDMDRIKWLKFFIYLTDVSGDNGPHFFVRGSHRTQGIPKRLLAKGYSRLSDAEVRQHYAPDELVQFVGPRGTVLAEDTRGLHKGLHVRKGDRLMLQIQFSNSLFGGSYRASAFRAMRTELREMATVHPGIYKNYLGNNYK